MWDDVNVPNIVLAHFDDTLYVLDSGLGPEQRNAIIDLAGRMWNSFLASCCLTVTDTLTITATTTSLLKSTPQRNSTTFLNGPKPTSTP